MMKYRNAFAPRLIALVVAQLAAQLLEEACK
jgi:hypothetical protein